MFAKRKRGFIFLIGACLAPMMAFADHFESSDEFDFEKLNWAFVQVESNKSNNSSILGSLSFPKALSGCEQKLCNLNMFANSTPQNKTFKWKNSGLYNWKAYISSNPLQIETTITYDYSAKANSTDPNYGSLALELSFSF